jgi:RNA polymerase sigma-70 factor (ECF subfamily)
VAEHSAELYRYAYRLAGQAADAEDLTQQTFLIAHSKLDQLRSAESCRSWLFAILRSCFLKLVRASASMPAATEFPLETLAAEVPEALDEDRDRLHKVLGELPPEFRLVLTMFYFEECSYRQIAEQLELPIGTVMSRLSRAKNHLRARLSEPSLASTAPAGRRVPR